MANRWQIKQNDKVLGPYSDRQLKELVAAGQVNRKTPIRSDGKSIWMVAGKVPELFPEKAPSREPVPNASATKPARSERVPVTSAQASPVAETIWHVGHDGTTFGPFGIAELTERVRSGWLRPTDLVWRPGNENWEPASTLEALFPSQSIATTPPPVPIVLLVEHGDGKPRTDRDRKRLATARTFWRQAMFIAVAGCPAVAILLTLLKSYFAAPVSPAKLFGLFLGQFTLCFLGTIAFLVGTLIRLATLNDRQAIKWTMVAAVVLTPIVTFVQSIGALGLFHGDSVRIVTDGEKATALLAAMLTAAIFTVPPVMFLLVVAGLLLFVAKDDSQ